MSKVRDPSDGSVDDGPVMPDIHTEPMEPGLPLDTSHNGNYVIEKRAQFHVPTVEELQAHYAKYNLAFVPKVRKGDST